MTCTICREPLSEPSYIKTPKTAKGYACEVCFNCAFGIATRLQFKIAEQHRQLQDTRQKLVDGLIPRQESR